MLLIFIGFILIIAIVILVIVFAGPRAVTVPFQPFPINPVKLEYNKNMQVHEDPYYPVSSLGMMRYKLRPGERVAYRLEGGAAQAMLGSHGPLANNKQPDCKWDSSSSSNSRQVTAIGTLCNKQDAGAGDQVKVQWQSYQYPGSPSGPVCKVDINDAVNAPGADSTNVQRWFGTCERNCTDCPLSSTVLVDELTLADERELRLGVSPSDKAELGYEPPVPMATQIYRSAIPPSPSSRFPDVTTYGGLFPPKTTDSAARNLESAIRQCKRTSGVMDTTACAVKLNDEKYNVDYNITPII